MRTFEIPVWETERLAQVSRQLGMDLFNPPNVKGWPGGNQWITSSSLLLREQFLTMALEGDIPVSRGRAGMKPASRPDQHSGFLAEWLENQALTDASELNAALLSLTPVSTPTDPESLTQTLLRLVKDPVYQVK